MPNPNINFRLSPYQIARGLYLVRKLEPTYTPSSVSQLVKTLYLDYMAKMSSNRSDIIPPSLVEEVKRLASPKRKHSHGDKFNLDDVISRENPTPFETPTKPAPTQHKDDSVITTATDFSIPKDWFDNINEEEDK